ncbi:Hpr(Ser) kinase/phosphatase [Rhodospirillum rubrum ATCC 11170]|uniref:Hpr(Ser) kinase/phosphatase n=1 Tax=Rhodospirillum rubrum (strain ATCC 11170 / ATH 1.1.1 / DSM 467 / LMG 4362 / NCIMB 8255 / S1) TaxID=269796 RepID=Q2RUW4_RHORT|nr:HPr kinase [Rhodospirillum rubrum]ABC22081.1 Hpr(Ser) kinase/phosphatase [Rhodospirillum rubrum ATCC 11170]
MNEMPVQPTPAPPVDAPSPDGDRDLFGWRVRADLPLPELPVWAGDGRAPDILIRVAAVSPLDDGAQVFSPRIRFIEATLCFDVPDVARYRVDGGHLVTIEAARGIAADAPEIRLFFFGTVLAVLCFRRGLIPLHASAVALDGRALLLSGESGTGKSTLAAALLARGYPLLSDDLCALDVSCPDKPMILPCTAHLKLWGDAAARLGIATDGMTPVRRHLDKFRIPVRSASDAPLGPGTIIRLKRVTRAEQVGTRPLLGAEALCYDLIHRFRLGIALGYQSTMLTALAPLVRSAPIIQLNRRDDLGALPDLADHVIRLARDERRD